jgi:N-methylhydantoinase B/oxoprolinase/acetone carboxylase alpha subunit
MDKIIRATFKLRGTEKEIERVKARIASLLACEECVSLYIREEELYVVEKSLKDIVKKAEEEAEKEIKEIRKEEKQNGRKKRKTSI